MTENKEYHENPQAVQAHLEITQSVIQRMSSNSASCKTYCITLVSAILVIVAEKGKPHYALIAIIPVALFMILDAYYLALERMFRKSYNTFIDKLHSNTVVASDFYTVVPTGNILKDFFASLRSFSIWMFYLTIFGLIILTKYVVL